MPEEGPCGPSDARTPMRRWSPPGRFVWDSWFARHEGRLHAFYLEAPVTACGGDAERRHDLASIGHATWSPGGWEEVGPALMASAEPGWDDLALWTGSIVRASPWAPFALFYTARRRDDAPVPTPHECQRPQQIGLALSDDLGTWRRSRRSEKGPVIPNPGKGDRFDGVAWRDPYVRRGEGGPFEAFICARLDPGLAPRDAGGAIAHVTAESLEAWGAPRLFLASDDFYQLEVPQVFWRRQANARRLYFLFSAQEKDCSARRRARMPRGECRTGTYWMSSEPVPLGSSGPPPLREPARILAPGLYAGRLVDPETAETPWLFGFPWPVEGEAFEGGILGPQTVRFLSDGAIEAAVPEVQVWPA